MRRWLLVALVLTATPAAAQTRYDQCLRESGCRARMEQAKQDAVDVYRATLPCQTFAYADEGQTLVGQERACIVIENVQPCGDDFCGTWPVRPEGQ